MPTINDRTDAKIGVLTSGGVSSAITGETSRRVKLLLLGGHGHYGYPNFPPDRNVGGLFRLETDTIERSVAGVGRIWRGGPMNTSYEGGVLVGGLSQIGGLSGWTDASNRGAEAFNKMKPAKPSWNGLNFIAEMKDLPKMLRARHEKLSDIGSYYLALKFGWEPLLKDIRNLVSTQRRAQDILKQLIKDNGKSIRRRVTLANNVIGQLTIQGSGYGAVYPVLDTWFYRKPPVFTDRHNDVERIWASGRFRYHLPPGPQDVNWRAAMLRKIYGLTPSPSVLWNAIPWTWLIDWFTNAGDVIENLESGVADKLAADYCYLMRERRLDISRETTAFYQRESGEPVDVTVRGYAQAKHCSRIVGSPFGFNISEQSLTGTQLAILGALGLSRANV